MNMRARFLGVGVLTLAGLFLVSAANAADTVRLSLPANVTAPTTTLQANPADNESDTMPVFHRGGFVGGYRGGYVGGFRGGYVGGYRGGFVGGYRGYYGGYGRYFGGYYPRSYASYYGGYYPRYYGGYYGGYYSPVMYGTYYPAYYYPGYGAFYTPRVWGYAAPVYYGNYGCAYSPALTTYAVPAAGTVVPGTPVMPRALDTAPAPGSVAPRGSGTYPYDGGPSNPVPTPMTNTGETLTQNLPRVPTLMDTVPVSVSPEKETGKWVYPAYGEAPRRTGTK